MKKCIVNKNDKIFILRTCNNSLIEIMKFSSYSLIDDKCILKVGRKWFYLFIMILLDVNGFGLDYSELHGLIDTWGTPLQSRGGAEHSPHMRIRQIQ